MNFFKESARLFEFYFKRKAHKLEPENDKFLQDVNALLSAVYDTAYADGANGALERFIEAIEKFKKDEGFQMMFHRTEATEYFKKTPHINREESK